MTFYLEDKTLYGQCGPLCGQAGLLYEQDGLLCGQVGSYLDMWALIWKMALCIDRLSPYMDRVGLYLDRWALI